ncbi:transcriptional regulator [Pseudoalteromonas haloplanktis]|nr:transcriptional regulator [Pseudoalteromonas haloplanktis]
MYPPEHFMQKNTEQLHALINNFPLATIFMPCSNSQLNKICHVPMLFNSLENMFIAHVAKHNPLSKLDNKQVNLLFNSDNCYLSPSYADNQTLPSWLYASVLVTAKVHIIKDELKKDLVMQTLTSHFEKTFEPEWKIDEVPEQHRNTMYQHLSFIELTPIHWQGNFKLSQNKSAATRNKIKQSLVDANKHSIAALF